MKFTRVLLLRLSPISDARNFQMACMYKSRSWLLLKIFDLVITYRRKPVYVCILFSKEVLRFSIEMFGQINFAMIYLIKRTMAYCSQPVDWFMEQLLHKEKKGLKILCQSWSDFSIRSMISRLTIYTIELPLLGFKLKLLKFFSCLDLQKMNSF